MAPAFAGRIRLREALLHPAARGYAIIVVDLSGTHFCGPAGLNVLVRTCNWAVAEGGELRLVLLTGAMRRMLAVTGLDCPIGISGTWLMPSPICPRLLSSLPDRADPTASIT